jgi:hypothetical protein
MYVYVAEVWNSALDGRVLIGVFSTLASAQKANHDYVRQESMAPVLLDWDHDDTGTVEWYSSTPDDKSFTCSVTRMKLDAVD